MLPYGEHTGSQNMYTLDANIFLRDANPYDPDHATCHLLLEQLEHQNIPIIVPLFVLVEIAGVLGRELCDPIRARLFVKKMYALPTISFVALDEELSLQAAELAADRALQGTLSQHQAEVCRPGDADCLRTPSSPPVCSSSRSC
jgi:predicted nucleic acid-binding protein